MFSYIENNRQRLQFAELTNSATHRMTANECINLAPRAL